MKRLLSFGMIFASVALVSCGGGGDNTITGQPVGVAGPEIASMRSAGS